MKLSTYLNSLERGRGAQLARALGTSHVYLCQLACGKRRTSAELALRLAEATDWVVRPHDLRPDLYPNPQDGLPQKAAA